LPNVSFHLGTEESREGLEDILSQGEILVRKLSATNEQCCTLNAKYGIIVKKKNRLSVKLGLSLRVKDVV
jgi:hypothetical protein